MLNIEIKIPIKIPKKLLTTFTQIPSYSGIKNQFQHYVSIVPNNDGDQGAEITFSCVSSTGAGKPPARYAPFFEDDDAGKWLKIQYVDAVRGLLTFNCLITAVEEDEEGFKKIKAKIDKDTSSENKLPTLDKQFNFWLPAIGNERGFPGKLAIYEGRLFITGSLSYPNRIWASSLFYADFTNFNEGSRDSDAFSIPTMAKGGIQWILSANKLFVADSREVFVIKGSGGFDEALTPASVSASKPFWNGNGILCVPPVKVDDTLLFLPFNGKALYEIILDGMSMQFNCLNLSVTARDLLKSGATSYCWIPYPHRQIWATTADGKLVCITYLRNSGVISFSYCELGGDAKALRVSSVVSENVDRLQVYVQRYVNGELKTCVERLSLGVSDATREFEGQYLDCASVYAREKSIVNVVRSTTDTLQFNDTDSVLQNEVEFLFFRRISGDPQRLNHPLSAGRPFRAIRTNADGLSRTYKLYNDLRYLNNANKKWGKINVLAYPHYQAKDFRIYARRGNLTAIENDVLTVINATQEWQDKSILFYGTGAFYIGNDRPVSLDYSPDNRVVFIVEFVENDRIKLKDGAGNFHVLRNYAGNGSGEAYVQILTSDRQYNLGKDSDIIVKENVDDIAVGVKCSYGLDNSSSHDVEKDCFVNFVDAERKVINLYEEFRSPIRGPYGNVVKVPLDNETESFTSFYEIIGSLYFYAKGIEDIDLYGDVEIDVSLDGVYQGKMKITDGRLRFLEAHKYVVLGYAYKGVLETLPVTGGSVLGSSQGSVGQIKNVLLSLYKSRGGTIGNNQTDKPSKINYESADNPLFTGEISASFSNYGPAWRRSVVIKTNGGEPLNVRSLTVDCQVSDN